ncbi:MAG TPA: hypothetical protein VKV40_11395 [Ktedonobacteraceae bacterium]|nr:hypothetical protein [Ktedonobacteraceae bacterium]
MFEARLRCYRMIIVLLICLALGLTIGHAVWISHQNANGHHQLHAKTLPVLATITLPRGQALFMPFILVVPLHTTVIWNNVDNVTHIIATTAQRNQFLNRQAFLLHLPPGEQARFTFNQAGLYHYYDPTRSTWNATLARVAADKGVPHFPLAMDGVIWVQGPISALPFSALNTIPAGHDDFASEFLAIRQPGGVTWHNFDEDPHFVGLVDGWSKPVNPVDMGLYRIAGTDDEPGGASVTALFTTPGLYYYYCRNHDQVDPLTHRARALPMASEYPIPMEGFVLVMSG